MADEISSLGKDVNKTLYEEDRVMRVAREMGYRGGSLANDIVKEIREDYLSYTPTSELATSELPEYNDNQINTVVETNDSIATLTEYTDEITEDQTDFIEDTTDVAIATSVVDTEIQTVDATNGGLGNNKTKLNTALSSVADESTGITGEMPDKMLLATSVVNKTLKGAIRTEKVVGGLVRFGKNFNIFDSEGKVDSINATGNQIKTAGRYVGRKAIKYANKGGMAISNKIMAKTVNKVTTKLTTRATSLSTKVSTKITAKGLKITGKITKVLLDFLGKLIIKIVAAVLSFSPLALALGVLAVVVMAVFMIFAPFTDKEGLEKFTTHISETQNSFFQEVKGYYDDEYKVIGTYNGEAYIDWRGALATLQGLDASIEGSEGEIWLLKQMENTGLMYSIDKMACEPYYRHISKKNAIISGFPIYDLEGNITSVNYNVVFTITPSYNYIENSYTPCTELSQMSQSILSNSGIYNYSYSSSDTVNNSYKYSATYEEGLFTDYMYQVTIGTLNDYKEWIKNNPDIIKEFYDKEGINYDKTTTNFLTNEVEEIMDSLYVSESFDMGLSTTGTNFIAQAVAGQIYDTGEHNGVLAYPTYARKLSATFPYYSNGTNHTGIDFAVPIGTPICACYDGEVIVVKELNYSYGYYVVIKHKLEDGKTIYTLYAHNSVLLVKQGDKVVQGQVIAQSGSTGNSTGPHCHLSVLTSWSPQTYVQPLDYL